MKPFRRRGREYHPVPLVHLLADRVRTIPRSAHRARDRLAVHHVAEQPLRVRLVVVEAVPLPQRLAAKRRHRVVLFAVGGGKLVHDGAVVRHLPREEAVARVLGSFWNMRVIDQFQRASNSAFRSSWTAIIMPYDIPSDGRPCAGYRECTRAGHSRSSRSGSRAAPSPGCPRRAASRPSRSGHRSRPRCDRPRREVAVAAVAKAPAPSAVTDGVERPETLAAATVVASPQAARPGRPGPVDASPRQILSPGDRGDLLVRRPS